MGVLGSQRFDCIIFSDILQRVHDPSALLKSYSALLANEGRVIVRGTNRRNIGALRTCLQGRGLYDAITDWYLTPSTTREFETSLLQSGLRPVEVVHRIRPRYRWLSLMALGMLNSLLAIEVVIAGKRS